VLRRTKSRVLRRTDPVRARDKITSADTFVTSPPSRPETPPETFRENRIYLEVIALSRTGFRNPGIPPPRKGATLYPASPIASRNAKVFCSRGRGIIYRGGESNPGMISGSIHSAGELREYYPSKRNTIRVSMHSNEHSSRPLDGFISNQRSHDAATLSLRTKSKMRRACAARQRKIWIFPNEDTVANAIAFVSAKMLKLNVIN